ncbi:MAG: hypothetical protein V4649_04445 [Bacteroidota bacterium]
MKNAKQYFETHDTLDQLYFTSDNLAFFDQQNAKNHAKQLRDKTVTALTRDEVYGELESLTAEQWEEEMQELLNDLDDQE